MPNEKNSVQKEKQPSRRQRRKNKYEEYAERRKKPGEKPQDFKGTLFRLLAYFGSDKKRVALVIIAGVFSTALSITGPLFLGDVVDAIKAQVDVKLAGGDIDLTAIAKYLGLLAAIYVFSSLLGYLQHYTMAGVTQKIVCEMRNNINQKISRMPLKYFDRNTKGDILSRIMNDVDNVSNTLQNNVIQIVTSAITFLGVLGLMLYVSWQMTLISFAVLPPALIIARMILKRSNRYFRKLWSTMGSLNGHVEEMYTGHKLIKVFNHEKVSTDEFDEINEELFEVSRKAQFISGMIMPLINFVNNIGYVLICVMGGLFVVAKKMTIGDITTFITYSKLFMQPLVDIANIANNLQSSLASAERVFSLLSEEDETPDDASHRIESPQGRVEFDKVGFCYSEDKPLIENMNLSVERGQLIAVVGPTGAGKTTLVNLLMRFYDVREGAIKVDGVDIRTIPRNNLRGMFGMVLQDTWLFKGTISENIAYGRQGATQEEVVEAAKSAMVHHFINTLADGYDTVLEEDGTNISQGQRQLLTIARAILADPPILILDEATSSVDTRTEVQIQQAMKTLMRGRTNFVIAHRLSTIKKADVILVMDHGSIIEQGTHGELLAKKGFYAELYNSQFTGCL